MRSEVKGACKVIPHHFSFSVLRETPMTFACGYLKKLEAGKGRKHEYEVSL